MSRREALQIISGFRPAAGLDANAADMLADDMLPPEFIQLFVAPAVIEIPRILMNGLSRAWGNAGAAAPA